MDEDIQNILNKYKGKIKKDLNEIEDYSPDSKFSQEYMWFRREALTRRVTAYESLCNSSERILNIQPKEKDYAALQRSIEASHLNITPVGAYSFSILTSIVLFIVMVLINLLSFLSTNNLNTNLILLTLFILLIIVFIIKPLTN